MSADRSTTQTTETPWKTIMLGTGIKDADGFRKALKDNGMSLSPWADDVLGKPQFTVALEPTEVILVLLKGDELVHNESATLREIHQAAKARGLGLCPAEVGPQLRLQHLDQPKGERLFIGMEPISDSGGGPSLFSVVNGANGLWLSSGWGHPNSVAYPSYRWVFLRPRN